MSEIRNIHRHAMEIADEAFMAKRLGELDRAKGLFIEAFKLEFEVAQKAVTEPSRSVLLRGAATLALHAELYREAERVAAIGLSGNPHPEIANELREVLEKSNFHRHLSTNGIDLHPEDLQMTLSGDAIADGMAPSVVVLGRIRAMETLIKRTGDRVNKRDFSSKSQVKSNFYDMYIAPPRAGSFAMTFRVGGSLQAPLSIFDNRASIIEELLHTLNLLNSKRVDDLKETINNDNYYANFVNLAKSLAPDGESVKMVGLTAKIRNTFSEIIFSTTDTELSPIVQQANAEVSEGKKAEEENDSKQSTIEGELLFADALGSNKIKILGIDGKKKTIHVSDAIAEDVVRPHFGRRVIANVVGSKGNYRLRDIQPID
jgi:hypothetical protein